MTPFGKCPAPGCAAAIDPDRDLDPVLQRAYELHLREHDLELRSESVRALHKIAELLEDIYNHGIPRTL